MNTLRTIRCLALVAAVAVLSSPALAGDDSEAPKLERVEARLVCMVNDHAYEEEQIAVVVAGRVYYGCCPMCKDRLAQDASIRTAVDPVSGHAVDKAEAVIAMVPDGSVLYFENEENLEAYAAKGAPDEAAPSAEDDDG